MSLRPTATWGSSAWNGWARIADLAIARDGAIWTVDEARFAARWHPVLGAPLGRVLLEGGGAPTAAALHPDGRHLVLGTAGGTLSLHDLTTGARRWGIGAVGAGAPQVPNVASIAVSHDGGLIATTAAGETAPAVSFWDAATGAPRGRAEGFARRATILPDGAHALLDGKAVVAIATGATVLEIPGQAKVGACSSDGRLIVTGDEKGNVTCWDVAKLRAGETEPLWRRVSTDSRGEPSSIERLIIAQDGTWALSTSTLRYRNWWLENGRPSELAAFVGSWRTVLAHDGQRAFGIELQRQRIRQLDLVRQGEVRPPFEHEEAISAIAVSPDGALLATGSHDRTIVVREVASGVPFGVLSSDVVQALAFAPDGRALLSADDGGGAMHAIPSRALVVRWQWFQLKCRKFSSVVATTSGVAIFGDDDGSLLCFDLATQTERWRKERVGAKHLALRGGDLVVTTTRRAIEIYDPQTGERKESFPTDDRQKTQPHVLLDDFAGLTIRTGRGLVQYEQSTGDEMRFFSGSEEADGVLVVSPDRRLALTAAPSGRMQLWDVRGVRLVGQHDFGPSFDAATCAVFGPDGRSLFVGTKRGLVLRFAV